MKEAALAAGFHKVGIARAEPLDPGPLDRMLACGAEADMSWLRTQRAQRLDPSRLLPGVKSVIALALAYAGDAGAAALDQRGRVARYARGRDYHAVMKKRLKLLLARLHERDPKLRALPTADVAPVMEKAWAERAGIGWVGKNGCLITTDLGSWVVLATVLVDRELDADPPHPERCGDCSACMPACPTGAIPEPGLVDARRCLSFHTIERRGAVPDGVASHMGRWAFGCDDCQTACPWNRAAGGATDPELAPTRHPFVELLSLVAMDVDEYRREFYGTALARAGHAGLVRNAILVAGANGERAIAPAVRRRLGSELPGVAEAARWALPRLGSEPAEGGE